MVWIYEPSTFLQAQAAVSGEDSSSGTYPLAPLKSTPTVNKYSCSDNKMEISPPFPSGTTCEPLAETYGLHQWVACMQGFLASHGLLQGVEKDKTIVGTYGLTPCGSLASYDRVTSS